MEGCSLHRQEEWDDRGEDDAPHDREPDESGDDAHPDGQGTTARRGQVERPDRRPFELAGHHGHGKVDRQEDRRQWIREDPRQARGEGEGGDGLRQADPKVGQDLLAHLGLGRRVGWIDEEVRVRRRGEAVEFGQEHQGHRDRHEGDEDPQVASSAEADPIRREQVSHGRVSSGAPVSRR